MRRLPRACVALGLALAALSSLGACGLVPSALPHGKIPVVAAENFYGDVLAQVCGNACQVTSIVANPDTDPHSFEPDVKDAVAISRAKLVVMNGLGYDAFMSQLLAASPSTSRQVIDVQSLMGAKAGANPHLWYDPATMPRLARAVARALSRIDPARKDLFRSRSAVFIASLHPLTRTITSLADRYRGVRVAYTEPVFGYMGEAIGLRAMTPPSFEEAVAQGIDPPAEALAAEDELIARHEVAVLIYNRQTVSEVTQRLQALARSSGVPVVGVTETEPAGTTYQTWMLSELDALGAALRGEAAAHAG